MSFKFSIGDEVLVKEGLCKSTILGRRDQSPETNNEGYLPYLVWSPNGYEFESDLDQVREARFFNPNFDKMISRFKVKRFYWRFENELLPRCKHCI